MAIPQTNRKFTHWNYFIALEEDLEKVARYIEFDEANYNTYSLELAHLLLAAGSEVDVVLGGFCKLLNPSKEHTNISHYQETIKESMFDLIHEKVYIPRYGLELTPFINWDNGDNLDWWTSYNKVKHHRDTHFEQANLKNTLNSLAALSLVTLYYYRHKGIEERSGGSSFKDITFDFHDKASLIQFKDGYTHKNIVG